MPPWMIADIERRKRQQEQHDRVVLQIPLEEPDFGRAPQKREPKRKGPLVIDLW